MLKVEVTTDWRGRPLEALTQLISRRQRQMCETARDAVVATAIDVVKSLRALTRRGPRKANAKSFAVEPTPYVASWERAGGSFRRVARVGGTGAKAPIFPVNRAGRHHVKGECVKVYRVTPKHGQRMTWAMNRNDGCWYVFAHSESEAKKFAVERMTRAINKHGGLARTAMGFAMHLISSRPSKPETSNEAARMRAERAIRVSGRGGGHDYAVTVWDDLDYAEHALEGGASAISLAMMRAANKIAGRIAQHEKAHFLAPSTATPFPEVVRRRR